MNGLTHWRLRHVRYRLLGGRCVACGQPVFPPRQLCPVCAELSILSLHLPFATLEVVKNDNHGSVFLDQESLQEVDLVDKIFLRV